jgi:hypothetical protein
MEETKNAYILIDKHEKKKRGVDGRIILQEFLGRTNRLLSFDTTLKRKIKVGHRRPVAQQHKSPFISSK